MCNKALYGTAGSNLTKLPLFRNFNALKGDILWKLTDKNCILNIFFRNPRISAQSARFGSLEWDYAKFQIFSSKHLYVLRWFTQYGSVQIAQGRVTDNCDSCLKDDSCVFLCTIQCAPQRGDKSLLMVSQHIALPSSGHLIVIGAKQRDSEYFFFARSRDRTHRLSHIVGL